MANKRYYWLKLKEDFFEQDEIKIIEGMPNGKDYIILYFKLLAKSIRTKGELNFKGLIPYSPEMLSTITNTNVDVVKSAISMFEQLKMIEVWDDGTIYMAELNGMIGSESESAARVRKHRELSTDNQKALQCNADVTSCNENVTTDRDKDRDKDKDNTEEISLQIKNLRLRYSEAQLKTIDDYFEILRTTRVSGKISPSVILKVYKKMNEYAPVIVEYATSLVVNSPAHHTKKENYLYGIMRNSTSDEAVAKLENAGRGEQKSRYKEL